jgi:mycothiol synthase
MVAIRRRIPEDDAALVDLLHGLNPYLPTITVDGLRSDFAMVPAGFHHVVLVAEHDRAVVGYGQVGEAFWTERHGTQIMDVGVDEAWRGQGIGTQLFESLLRDSVSWGAERVYGDVREDVPEARSFAAHRGFIETEFVGRTSRLVVAEANLEGYEGLADRLGHEGIRVERLVNLDPDETMYHSIHALQMEAGRDEPSSESFSMPFEQWLNMIQATHGLSPESIWVALDGDRPIGQTMLRRSGEGSGYQFGLGVLRQYRGRGVARLMKLKQIEWARDHGVSTLYTSNDINNPRIYDINMRLGYQALPPMIRVLRMPPHSAAEDHDQVGADVPDRP